jgi:predicted YcjX-like family ATPase
MFGRLIDDMLRSVEDARDSVLEALTEPTLRVGVTGLSRAGKTVFITSLVANMLERGRMSGLVAESDGRIEAVALRPQPDRGVPRFDYETHIGKLRAREPIWPDSTRAVAQLRLSIRFKPDGWFSGFSGPSTLHLDIVDYPGEWLLDLTLLERSYDEWAAETLEAARQPLRVGRAKPWLELIDETPPDAPYDEALARRLSEAYTEYLHAARRAGLSRLTPGRFLMPGEMEGSPALTFTPLPPGAGRRGSLRAEFEKRYAAYLHSVVKPFFREHFARLERQVVIVDLLTSLDRGPGAVADLQAAMTEILQAFRPGSNSWLSSILGKRVDRILFAAAKADHVHHTQHGRMTDILRALLRDSVERAAFRGAKTEALAVAGVRATVEQDITRNGETLPCVRGKLKSTGKMAALFPGDLPESPHAIVAEARHDAPEGAGWMEGDLEVMDFAPPAPGGRAGEGPPHIRLDRAVEFLIGDHLA